MIDTVNTRRWPRFHVHLPVFIATESRHSKIVIPGLVSEISRGGMELYGGVQRGHGELIEVEFRPSGSVRVAGIVRYRSGYCFGLEFVQVTTGTAPFEGVLPAQAASSDDGTPTEETYAELFLDRHESYMHDMQQQIDRLREKTLKIRQFRIEMEHLLQGGTQR